MIRTKKWYRYLLLTYLIENSKSPEENIATVQKYMDFIYDAPTKEKVINIAKSSNDTKQVLPKKTERRGWIFPFRS